MPEHPASLLVLHGDASSPSLIGSMALVGFLGYALYYVGLVGRAVELSSRLIRWAVRHGFRSWEETLAWADWWVLLLIDVGLLSVGFAVVKLAPPVAIGAASVSIYVGATTCLAFMFIDIERYEVERGYKALHDPLKGQGLAVRLARHGPRVGVMLLVAASVAIIGGFALVNEGLCESGHAGWFDVHETGVGRVDFLAYALLNLLRVVDVLDLARSKQLLDAAYVRPAAWPASLLVVLFRSFFTLVLLQQIFASIRQGRLLADTITDFWSPHEPIQQRARNALPQYGAAAVEPLLLSLRSVTALTQEQRDQLPAILAAIGPSTIPALQRHLADPHDRVRAACAASLGRLEARDALPRLAALAGDPSERVRQALAEALGRMAGPPCRVDRHGPAARRALRTPARRANRSLGSDPVGVVILVLRDLVADASAAVRAEAAAAAGLGGSRVASLCPDLVRRLRDDDEMVRCRAAEALGDIGASTDEVLDALTSALRDPAPGPRAAAARGLGRLGPGARPAMSRLVPLLQDRDEIVRAAAAEAIARAGPLDESSTAELIKELSSADNVVRARAAEALGVVGTSDDSAAAALAKVLRDGNDVVRAKAAEALGKMGEAAADVAVPGLVRALRDRDSWVSALAAEALGEFGEAADAAAPALVRALRHMNAQVRANAAVALGRLGVEAGRARTALEKAAADEDGGVRAQAVRALGLLGTVPPASLAVIVEAIRDSDPVVREAAVEALGRAGRSAADVRQLVLPLLDDPNDLVKVRAMSALAEVGGAQDDTVAGLCRVLSNDDSPWVRVHAAMALGRMGPSAIAAGPALLKSVRLGDVDVREQAMRAIVLIRPSEAAEALALGLTDTAAEVRLLASAGWARAGTVPEDAVPVLVESLRDPETRVRANAALALSGLEHLPPAAVPLLAEQITDANDGVRLNVALALRRAPPETSAPILEALLDDPNGRIRLIAAGSLLDGDPAHAAARAAAARAVADPSPRVCQSAEELLRMLPPPAVDPVRVATGGPARSVGAPVTA